MAMRLGDASTKDIAGYNQAVAKAAQNTAAKASSAPATKTSTSSTPAAAKPVTSAAPAKTDPYAGDPLMQLVSQKGWAWVNANGLNPNAPAGNTSSSAVNYSGAGDTIPASAYDPSGTLTMGGGLGTAEGPEGDAFRQGQLDFLNGGIEKAYPDATADPQYQMQLALLANSLANFQANQRLALSQYDDQLGENLNRMGWNAAAGGWDPKGQGSYGQDFRNNEGDFASRGAFYSGPHITSQNTLNFGYNSQKNDMDNARARFAQAQNQALSQMQSQNELTKQDALTQAVARIAAQQGIDFNKVPGAGQLTALQ